MSTQNDSTLTDASSTPDSRVGSSDSSALREENARLRAALERIEKWAGEFPPSGRYWDEPTKTRPMSYGAAFGSNGERDYMRSVARQALLPNVPGQPRSP